MTTIRAIGHANITWWCPYCDSRNRAHVAIDYDTRTMACERCNAEADIFPTQVIVYSSPLLGETEGKAS